MLTPVLILQIKACKPGCTFPVEGVLPLDWHRENKDNGGGKVEGALLSRFAWSRHMFVSVSRRKQSTPKRFLWPAGYVRVMRAALRLVRRLPPISARRKLSTAPRRTEIGVRQLQRSSDEHSYQTSHFPGRQERYLLLQASDYTITLRLRRLGYLKRDVRYVLMPVLVVAFKNLFRSRVRDC